jgi:hypothetical protein
MKLSNFLFGLFLASVLAVPVYADGWGHKSAMLTRPGEAVEVKGITLRAIAFYEGGAEDMRLTVLLSGSGLGSEVLRLGVRLRDGQSHAMTLGGGQGRVERFSFVRSGREVAVEFDTLDAPRPAETASVEPADPEVVAAAEPDRMVADLDAPATQ